MKKIYEKNMLLIYLSMFWKNLVWSIDKAYVLDGMENQKSLRILQNMLDCS